VRDSGVNTIVKDRQCTFDMLIIDVDTNNCSSQSRTPARSQVAIRTDGKLTSYADRQQISVDEERRHLC